jgi:hypothetical protein
MLFSYDQIWSMTKLMMTSKCTSIAARFEGLADAPEQYRRHCLMRHVQGYSGSHWMPPLGNYSFHIAQGAARATANKTTAKNGPILLAISMDAAVLQYNTTHIAQWRRSKASLEATGRHHRASVAANSINGTWLRWFFMFFIVNTLKKVAGRVKGPCFQ